ncbi:MAG: hypothetical protein LKF87_14600 [Clostridium tyrobutyricum]|jgi:hypothetical protein|uniref:hypothetical protein n=1 Tax=Clostridium tyrobutyricum TaxID=1519 RepID=UPI00242EDF1E|nr:hypothetical protein [Clostridium tyrobutyricum]MCH4200648.1 hypothetical protein [Clostridium tyrobutyricum]MCH4237546.1 hypothetical protein [Clostridium tyrobutyricum]MCH4260143.1 hypothetical protein [Clostridium tyrobutyricum]MCI2011747.1 hypothetical protein [Clostridium tyrobutyricum]
MNLENKSSMEIRLIMKESGWESKDNLTYMGWGRDKKGMRNYGYSIWFERWDWHGRNTFCLTGQQVCFHRHTDNLSEIDHITRLCAEQALRAYKDYKDCIPCQIGLNKTGKANMVYDWNNSRAMLKS